MSLKKQPGLAARRISVLRILAMALFCPFPPESAFSADKPAIEEYQLKAVFVSKLPLFVEWPETSGNKDELLIGVLGISPFGDYLESACREQSQGRKLSVKMCAGIEEACQCQVVFICASEQQRLLEILDRLHHCRVLTVGDVPAFAESGGMVALSTRNRKVQLEVNLERVRKTGLRVDPHLLQLCRVVGSPETQENAKP
jgi:hypothetical protein